MARSTSLLPTGTTKPITRCQRVHTMTRAATFINLQLLLCVCAWGNVYAQVTPCINPDSPASGQHGNTESHLISLSLSLSLSG